MQTLERCAVDLFLCGHVHFSYVEKFTGGVPIAPGMLAQEQHGIIICQSGTTTSRRGRGTDRGKNSFNVIEIDEQTIRIHPYFYVPQEQRFAAAAERVFLRQVLQQHRQEQ
jgi:hypothetical protein